MSQRPLYVSFYTEDYTKCATNLMSSLKEFKLPHEVKKVPDLGSWQRNTQYKPKFLWEKLTRNAGRPIVWVDADAQINDNPILFDTITEDVGVCRVRRPGAETYEILSGTLYFKNTAPSQKLVDAWIETCAENLEHWDQTCLGLALERVTPLTVRWLPVSYCYIYDTHKEQFPDVAPVIEHFQYSRQTRGKRK